MGRWTDLTYLEYLSGLRPSSNLSNPIFFVSSKMTGRPKS